MIEKATFKECKKLDDCRFAPNVGEIVFIIDNDILIHNNEVITDFDVEYYREIFEVVETY